MVCQTDKNLGPAIIECTTYIQSALTDHLLSTNTYQRLSKVNAEQEMTKTSHAISSWLRQYKHILPNNEYTNLQRTHKLHNKQGNIAFPQFYLLAKIHKNPTATHPIISISSSLLHGLGRWVDCQLQPYGQAIPSYIQSSKAYLQHLRDLQI